MQICTITVHKNTCTANRNANVHNNSTNILYCKLNPHISYANIDVNVHYDSTNILYSSITHEVC